MKNSRLVGIGTKDSLPNSRFQKSVPTETQEKYLSYCNFNKVGRLLPIEQQRWLCKNPSLPH
jgi:hypothetical protein